MNHLKAVLIICLVCLTTAASAQVIDDFENGDKSAWETPGNMPYYATVSVVSPGAGGSTKALALTYTPGSANSVNALVHRMFAAPANWSAYSTLDLDAKISAGAWDGYSIRVYNNNKSALIRGIHSDSATSDFRTISFDISGIQRDQITEIVIYINRTMQNAGQTLTIDNLKLSNTPVPAPPSTVTLLDFDSVPGDIYRWMNNPPSASYQTTATMATDPAPSGNVVELKLTGSSTSAYGQWAMPKTMDWGDYTTLEFDARLSVGTNPNGFSARPYVQGNPVNLRTYQGTGLVTRRFTPGTSGYVTCQMDISGYERDQASSIMFYLNRTAANAGQAVRIDNIRLTNNPVAAPPDVLWLDTFDTYTAGVLPPVWDLTHASGSRAVVDTDFISAPNALDVGLVGTSTSAYARRSWTLAGETSYDICDYKSLIFDAKVVPGPSPCPVGPVGFSANLVIGLSGGGAGNQYPFYPSAYNQWETYVLDITNNQIDQLGWLRMYTNRCAVSDIGQILRIDNVRASMDPRRPCRRSIL